MKKILLCAAACVSLSSVWAIPSVPAQQPEVDSAFGPMVQLKKAPKKNKVRKEHDVLNMTDAEFEAYSEKALKKHEDRAVARKQVQDQADMGLNHLFQGAEQATPVAENSAVVEQPMVTSSEPTVEATFPQPIAEVTSQPAVEMDSAQVNIDEIQQGLQKLSDKLNALRQKVQKETTKKEITPMQVQDIVSGVMKRIAEDGAIKVVEPKAVRD